MDDENHTTCLSSEPHNGNIKEHLTHFLGCIDASERFSFLNDDNYSLWKDETRHYHESQGFSMEKAEETSRKKRERWKSDCESELRRIDFLRRKLQDDPQDRHMVLSVRESANQWKQSRDYLENIARVQKWRSGREKIKKDGQGRVKVNETSGELCEPVTVRDPRSPYESEKDVNVPFMYFVDSIPAEEELKPGIPIWGKFPDQKTTVHHILNETKNEENLLSRKRLPNGIKYFHFPSNNMKWAEEAIARYFVQERPNFHAMRREVQRQSGSEAALVLKESHWRGQLHGGRNTTNSRFMRPFCEAVSSNPKEVDTVPQNVVLFMPYLHWETTRNRERFAQLIEEVVYKKKKQRRRAEKDAKLQRQHARRGLRPEATMRPMDVTPKSSSLFGRLFRTSSTVVDGSDHGVDHEAPGNSLNFENNSDDDGSVPSARRQLRNRDRIYTMGTLLQRLRLRKSPLDIDGNGRLLIPGTERNKLGQYLIDAARLYEGMTSYRDKKLLENYLMSDPPLHPRRTLDQAYYWSLSTTRARDRDQVVYRHTTPDLGSYHTYDCKTAKWDGHDELSRDQVCEHCTDNIKKVSRLVMVDQLWMWILDSKTIITCFPKRYGGNKHDSSGVHKSVRLRIAEGRYKQVKSVYDLALIILEECSNTFFDRTRTSDKQPQVFDAFSEAIGNIMHKQTVGFERLWRWTEDARKYYRSRSNRIPSDIHVPLLDINPEGELEKEIKDIVEELGIMLYVNKEHRDVIRQFIIHVTHILDPNDQFQTTKPDPLSKYFNPIGGQRTPISSPMPSPRIEITDPMNTAENSKTKTDTESERREKYKWFRVNADELLTRVNDRIEQLEELERSAEATASSVKDLLDLKSQQAGVFQAWQAMKQSEESTRQGRSIMVFTVVTIVFLPLSFMSSIFGMNAIEFTDENGNSMHLRQQITWMLVFSVVIFLTTLLFSLSSWVRAAVWYVFKRVTTTVFVRTGLYSVYLDRYMPSAKLYEEALQKTEKLKDAKKKSHLQKKRQKREAEEKRKEQDAAAARCGLNNDVGVRRRGISPLNHSRAAAKGPSSTRLWIGKTGDIV